MPDKSHRHEREEHPRQQPAVHTNANTRPMHALGPKVTSATHCLKVRGEYGIDHSLIPVMVDYDADACGNSSDGLLRAIRLVNRYYDGLDWTVRDYRSRGCVWTENPNNGPNGQFNGYRWPICR